MDKIFTFETFYLFGIFQGIILVILLLLKARSKANYFLVILISLLSIHLTELVLFMDGGVRNHPHILYSTLPLTFLFGPLIYHFVRLSSGESQIWKKTYFLHFAPFVYEFAVLFPFYILPGETKIAIYEYSIQNQGGLQFNQYSFGYLLFVLSTVYFTYLSFKLLKRINPQKKKGQKKKKLLIRISILITVYLALNLVLYIAAFFITGFNNEAQKVSMLLLSVLIHLIGFICYLNPEVMVTVRESAKYVNSSLTIQQVKTLGLSLISVMEKKQLFLNQELKPQELADEIGVSTTNLSRIISEGLNTNFYNLTNEHRVKKAKELLVSKEYSNAKLLHIAFDSGFSNKSSFIRNFKRVTGMSPREFRKKSENNVPLN